MVFGLDPVPLFNRPNNLSTIALCSGQVSNLVFYAQSTIMVISGPAQAKRLSNYKK